MARAMRSLARPDAAVIVADEICKFLFSEQRDPGESRRSVSTESPSGDR